MILLRTREGLYPNLNLALMYSMVRCNRFVFFVYHLLGINLVSKTKFKWFKEFWKRKVVSFEKTLLRR
jgi:hypothetical protein